MKFVLVCCISLACTPLLAQQLYLEGFGSFNRTDYSTKKYANPADYLAFGSRLAIGADHFQVGGEYRSNLTHPEFKDTSSITTFKEYYYGAFLRTKFSRYPAMRFGIVLRAGAGVYNNTVKSDNLEEKYDPILGFNGGLGFSIPMFNHTMLEFGYTYNYLSRPGLDKGGIPSISEHNGSYHLLSAGLSLNFVFGERAKQYQHAKENWKFRNGWKG